MVSGLDDIDRRILAELGRDGRMPIRQLAETLHISRANAYARVQRLRETNVIRGFRADIDHVAAGMGTSAYVTVNLHQAEVRAFAPENGRKVSRPPAARPACPIPGKSSRPKRALVLALALFPEEKWASSV